MRDDYEVLLTLNLLKDMQDKGDEKALAAALLLALEALCELIPTTGRGTAIELILRLYFKHQGNLAKILQLTNEKLEQTVDPVEHHQQLQKMQAALLRKRKFMAMIDCFRDR